MTTTWAVAFVLLTVFVLGLAILVLGTLRRIVTVLEMAEMALRPDPEEVPGGLKEGEPVGEFQAEGADGSSFTSTDLRGRPSIVLLLDTECQPCDELVHELERSPSLSLGIDVVTVFSDRSEGRELEGHRAIRVIYQDNREVARAFRSNARPHAFLIDDGGRVVASSIPNSIEHLTNLAARLTAQPDVRESREVIHA